MNILQRLKGFAIGQDEALNALGGGSPRQTISGTCGRASRAGKQWAWLAVCLIDLVFGHGHCLRQADLEAAQD